MTDIVDEEDPPSRPKRWRAIAQRAIQFIPPIISVGCAIVVGYFTYFAAQQKPPADMAALAVSILKSKDAPPEMRDWAENALGIQSDIQMPAKFAQQ